MRPCVVLVALMTGLYGCAQDKGSRAMAWRTAHLPMPAVAQNQQGRRLLQHKGKFGKCCVSGSVLRACRV